MLHLEPAGLPMKQSFTLSRGLPFLKCMLGRQVSTLSFQLEQSRRPVLTFIQLQTSLGPISLRLTLKADSAPEFVISDLDVPS